jgi:hypothetical protein
MAEAPGKKESKGVTGKCKKRSRNANRCKAYFNAGRREKNKIRALTRHLKHQPNDECAKAALKKVEKALPGTRFKRLSA